MGMTSVLFIRYRVCKSCDNNIYDIDKLIKYVYII